jgi:hypothetical protein
MAAARPVSLTSDAEVEAAVDELLGAFAADPGAEPDDTGFVDPARAPMLAPSEGSGPAPSADPDALWSAPARPRKPRR